MKNSQRKVRNDRLGQTVKEKVINLQNIGVLIHNAYSCTQINGICLMTSFIIVML